MLRPRWFQALLLLPALLILAGPARAAQGTNLAWSRCLGDGGVSIASFACNTNAGSHDIVGSFVLESAFPNVIGLEIFVDFASASPTLPAWWTLFHAGTCRPASLSASFIPVAADVNCADWSGSQLQVGGIATYCTSSGTCSDHPTLDNRALLKLAVAVAQQDAALLDAGTEYLAFRVRMDHANTVGAGACAGCATPMCIVLRHINVVDRGNVSPRLLTTGFGPGTNVIGWQGLGPVPGGLDGCPAVTAAKRSSWGALKSMYR